MGDILKISIIMVLGILFLSGTTVFTVAAQETEGQEKGIDLGDETNGTPESNSEGPQGYTEMFGQFENDEDRVTGRYVSFGIEDGNVTDYNFVPEAEGIFSSICSSISLFDNDNIRMEGAVFHAEIEELHFMSHNNPTSMVHITFSGIGWTNITFTLYEGLNFGDVLDEEIPITGLGSEAWISFGTAQYDVEGNVLNINMTNGIVVSFCRDPYQTRSSFQESLMRAVSSGGIDSELQVMTKNNGSLESQLFPYQGKVEMQVKGSESGKMVRIEVNSQEKEGKTLTFKVQGQVLGDVDIGKVRIEFDGEKAEMVGSVNEVLYGNTTKCQYYLIKDEEGCYQAMVYVPSFSSHEITFITEDDTTDTPFLSFGLLILFLSVGSTVAISVMIGRKK